MTLEERYQKAPATSYVGKVRDAQAADVGSGAGVNFMDGEGKSKWESGKSPAPDQYQNEFTRNAEGDFRYGGGGKVPGSPDNTYKLSRWLTKGTQKGDTYLTNNRFTTINDTRNANTLLQRYNWMKEDSTFAGKLPALTKGKVNGAPSGPAPAGLNG